MKVILRIALIAAILGSAYYFYKKKHPDFTYAGTLEAETVDLSPGVASPISTVLVREGQSVSQGQLILQLACPDVRVAVGQADSDLARNQRLFDAGSLAAANFDKSRFVSRDARVKLAWCDVSAPISGTVLTIYRRVGEWARPGQNLLTLADLRSLYAWIYVPQADLAKLKIGQELNGLIADLPAKKFPGVIEYIRPEAEFTPKNVQTRDERERLVYGVKVRFANPEGALKMGQPIETDLPR
jgi:HlyD family secretion protein